MEGPIFGLCATLEDSGPEDFEHKQGFRREFQTCREGLQGVGNPKPQFNFLGVCIPSSNFPRLSIANVLVNLEAPFRV